jgi:signal transduction histidine kinase
LVAVFVALIAGIGAAGALYYKGQRSAISRKQLDELSAIADAKATQIATWRRERTADAGVIFANPIVTASLRRVIEGKAPAAETGGVRAWLGVLVQSEYDAAFLMDRHGKVVMSAGRSVLPPEPEAAIAMAEAPRITLSDLHRAADSTIHLDLAVPIRAADGAGAAGALALYIDPRRVLFSLVQTWPTPSPTAETLLVRRDGERVTYLNELRHRQNTALRLSLPLANPRLPAAEAALGREGTLEGSDYRGVPVLATTRRVPDSPWAIVAKIDAEEVIQPVRQMAWMVGTLAIVLIAAAGACAAWLWRGQQARFYRQRYQAELERKELERQLWEARRRESIGALAAGVAHNFNNAMMIVLGHASLLEAVEPLPAEARAHVEGVMSGAQHAADLTSKLLAYSGGGRFVWQPIDLAGEARQAVARIRDTLPEGVRIEMDPGENLPFIKADRAQIDLLLTNLMRNGVEAIGESGGTVRLSMAAVDIDAEAAARAYPEISPGPHVRLTVTDTGAGMDENTKSRIFDPFFTTKFLGRGLGLAAAHGIVRGHNGAIRVESAPGKGSVFVVLLPAG